MKIISKFTMLAASMVAGVALVGAGFASWVIGNEVESAVNGNVYTQIVADNSLEISADVDGNIVYGSPEEYVAEADSWLTSDGGAESMTVTISLSVDGPVDYVEVALTIKDDGGSTVTNAYNDCIASGIIADYALTCSESDAVVEKMTTGVYKVSGFSITQPSTITLTASFGWGTLTNNMNPIEFYNAYAPDDILTEVDGVLVEGQVEGGRSQTAIKWVQETLGTLNSVFSFDGSEAGRGQFIFTVTASSL